MFGGGCWDNDAAQAMDWTKGFPETETFGTNFGEPNFQGSEGDPNINELAC